MDGNMGRKKSIDQNHILDAAETVVARDGAARMTLDAVAQEAGISKGSVVYDHGSEQGLLRAMKEATVKSFHYASIIELRRHVRDWLIAYNFARQVKLSGSKPHMRPSRNSGNQSKPSLSSSQTITCSE